MNTYHDTKTQIAQGVSRHIAQCADMGYDAEPLEVMQVAFQILNAMHPTMEQSGQENRDFIIRCGFSAETAAQIVTDLDEPNAIY